MPQKNDYISRQNVAKTITARDYISRKSPHAPESDKLLINLFTTHKSERDLCPISQRNAWMRERLAHAISQLSETISVRSTILGGVPCLAGTRFPISRVFAELSDNSNLHDIADDYELNEDSLRNLLSAMSLYFEKSGCNDRISIGQEQR